MTRMMKLTTVVLLTSLVASCGAVQKLKPKKGLYFDGQRYRVRAQKVGDEREEFQATVSKASRSIEGTREAGRHASVTYCINNYGRSDIEWAEGQGPDDENIEQRIVNDQVTFRGRCKAWS
ncbi:hypothetical protein RXV86_16725 [Alisedimentitalea sp. MJ-SS2]|uniref:hypothetical protein n=1 Tax=Aliisedimentitalea sp. MJ-SS2 TaxID=3049795 RepID=UPI00290E1C7F|nr:hypothetical protein [Alisedimentitalea sp. MJ-SS2]MDU8929040.1 hypothetical protein [Alisedimentitalea sp. MJ-SS2]